jgi:CDP-diacylglycerol--glycerol-3-phosphate 3-phosphatidyltransferase
VLSLGVPLAAWIGGTAALSAGVALVLLSALADSVDGALAVITRRASRLGHVLDSVADRLSEAAWGLAVWLLGAPAWLAILITGLGWLHEYVRARATLAGMRDIGAVTVCERPTRVIMMAVTLTATGVAGNVWPGLTETAVVGSATIWALVAEIGLFQLWQAVRRALGETVRTGGHRA